MLNIFQRELTHVRTFKIDE